MSKKILIDGTASQGTKSTPFHGGAEFSIYILEQALEYRYKNFELVFYEGMITNVRVEDLIKRNNLKVHYVKDKEELYKFVNNGGYDVFFSVLPYSYTKPFKSSVQFIGIVHGLRDVELPIDRFKYKYEKSIIRRTIFYLLAKSEFAYNILRNKCIKSKEGMLNSLSTIITVSEHSKYSIIQFFPQISPDRLVVIPSPVELKEYKKGPNNFGKYFLILNANRFEKNAYRAVCAFDILFSKKLLGDAKVVMTGADKVPFKKEPINADRFIYLGYLPNPELESLIANAFAIVFPSLNEGYGLPSVFGMKNRVPVAASSSTSIPEVSKDAVIYFDPTNIPDMSNRFLQLYYNEELRNSLIERGLNNIKTIEANQKKDVIKLLKIVFE